MVAVAPERRWYSVHVYATFEIRCCGKITLYFTGVRCAIVLHIEIHLQYIWALWHLECKDVGYDIHGRKKTPAQCGRLRRRQTVHICRYSLPLKMLEWIFRQTNMHGLFRVWSFSQTGQRTARTHCICIKLIPCDDCSLWDMKGFPFCFALGLFR